MKKKKNMETMVSYFRNKTLVIAHQNKHPKGVLLPKNNI
jgi:hypothetical protein